MALSACSNRKDGTEATFKEAIEARLAAVPQMCVFVDRLWPSDVSDSDSTASRYSSLAAAGLLSATAISVPNLDSWGKTLPGHRYDLTANGKKYLEGGVFCYGKARFKELISSEPVTTVAGLSSTKVYFKYEIDDLQDWAKRSDVQTAFPEIKSAIQGQENGHMMMKLIMDGDHWHQYD